MQIKREKHYLITFNSNCEKINLLQQISTDDFGLLQLFNRAPFIL